MLSDGLQYYLKSLPLARWKSDVDNIGLPIGEGLGGSLGLASDCKVTTLFLLYKNFACFFCVKQFEIFVINQ